jgi:1,4-alpha-glucan branching enzyme
MFDFMKTTKQNSAARKPSASASARAQIKTVHIEFSDAVAESVAIAGTFNDWRPDATPMVRLEPGRWIKQLTLPPGTYEYCFVLDGAQWCPDPRATEQKPNPFGGNNSVLTVPDATQA